jgi:hypothetical protein
MMECLVRYGDIFQAKKDLAPITHQRRPSGHQLRHSDARHRLSTMDELIKASVCHRRKEGFTVDPRDPCD